MGFCLYNNIAIGARHAQANYPAIRNVLIVDFDVHHGNGTQDIFYDDPSVFYYSLHQYPWYPGTGAANERGVQAGEGYTLNVPIAPTTTAREYLQEFELGLEHIARHFTPDLILVSAGFDAHIADPLGQLTLTNHEYEAMTRRLTEWADAACQGRLVSCLEGGYNLDALAHSATHTLSLLHDPNTPLVDELGRSPEPERDVSDLLGEMQADTALSQTIRNFVMPHSRLKGEANLLIMPNLDSANIAFQMVKVAADALPVGPILIGAARPAHVLTPSVTARGIVNMTAIAVAEALAIEENETQEKVVWR